ncbi:MAG: hypothetical protein AAFP77_26645 [Bacteroidota bacterium]
MKSLKTVVFVLLSFTVSAQVIDANWMFSVGDTAVLERVELLNELFDPGPGGVDVVWDFSSVDMDSVSTPYSIQYNSADAYGSNALSQTATFSAFNSSSPQRILYFDFNGEELLYLGDSLLYGPKRIYDIPVTQFPFPFEFDQVISEFAILDYFDNMGDLAFENDVEITRTFDGVGTLITPLDTFTNCVRMKEELIFQPLTFPRRYETYSWYYNNLSNEMALISLDYTLNKSFIDWQVDQGQVVTSTQDVSAVEPVVRYLRNGQFFAENLSGLHSVIVLDALGRQLGSDQIDFHDHTTYFALDHVAMGSGVHFLVLVNAATKEFSIHKFVP